MYGYKSSNFRGAFGASLLLSVFLVFTAFSAMEGEDYTPPRESSRRNVSPAVSDAIQQVNDDIANKLDIMYELIIAGQSINQEDLKHLQDSLRQQRNYLSKMAVEEQGKYYILNAWADYFHGDYQKSLREAMAANKLSSGDPDIEAALITMSALAGELRTAKMIVPTKKPESTSLFGTTGSKSSSSSSSSSSMGSLGFDKELIRGDMLGERFESCEIECINGSTVSFSKGKNILCVLFWKHKWFGEQSQPSLFSRPKQDDYDGERYSSESSSNSDKQTIEIMESLKPYFLNNYSSPAVKFVALNVDSSGDSKALMDLLFKNSWPWSHAIASNQSNKKLAGYAGMETNRPLLAIVNAQGEMCYVGPSDSVVPGAIISGFARSFNPAESDVSSQSSVNIDEQTDLSVEDKSEVGLTAAEDKTSVDTGVEIEETETAAVQSEELVPEAENWYQMALFHKKSAKFLGYKKMVDYCRMIMEKYPASSYSEKARVLLREIPDKDRKLYDITDEELGL